MLSGLYTTLMGTLIGILTTSAGAFIGWLFHRKSEAADTLSKEMDNKIKISEYYKSLLDDSYKRHEKRFNDITNLYDRKIKLLESEILFLKKRKTRGLDKDLKT